MCTGRLHFFGAGEIKCTARGRLSFSQGEGEGEGLSRVAVVRAVQPLTSVLSPPLRGEAAGDPARTNSVASLPSL
jgi:hypothetical protein